MDSFDSLFVLPAGSKNNYRIDANQELFAIGEFLLPYKVLNEYKCVVPHHNDVSAGLTNIMGSFVSAYPVTGSFGRSVCMIMCIMLFYLSLVCIVLIKHKMVCKVTKHRVTPKGVILCQCVTLKHLHYSLLGTNKSKYPSSK